MNDSMSNPVSLRSVSSARSELAALLADVAGGDRAAMAEVYRRTSAKLFGISLRLLGSRSEAEEVLQDVYLTVWRKAGSFDAARASPITWLSVMARNRAIDRLRRQGPGHEAIDAAADVADDLPTPFDLAADSQDRGRLADCLEQLDEQPRAMIRKAFVDGATYRELAEVENVPLGTMKSWIRRALTRLRGCLEQ